MTTVELPTRGRPSAPDVDVKAHIIDQRDETIELTQEAKKGSIATDEIEQETER